MLGNEGHYPCQASNPPKDIRDQEPSARTDIFLPGCLREELLS